MSACVSMFDSVDITSARHARSRWRNASAVRGKKRAYGQAVLAIFWVLGTLRSLPTTNKIMKRRSGCVLNHKQNRLDDSEAHSGLRKRLKMKIRRKRSQFKTWSTAASYDRSGRVKSGWRSKDQLIYVQSRNWHGWRWRSAPLMETISGKQAKRTRASTVLSYNFHRN